MFPILVAGPAVEPVSTPEMKAYLRVDNEAEDALVEGLVTAARQLVESTTRRILVEQSWRLMLHAFPESRRVALPVSPLIAVEEVRVFDAAGAATVLPADAFDVDACSDPPHVWFSTPPGQARHGIVIDFQAGFGSAPEDVPAPLRLAIKIIVARWFENRGDAVVERALPFEALALMAPFQRPRL